ncbi:Phosphoglycerate mutase (fragment) [Bacillus mycoides]|uniref:Phosphoglycerate mutase n=1 Tax=Bacillus mycoides TaxID=1405 RepID=A0A653YEH0_BACMY
MKASFSFTDTGSPIYSIEYRLKLRKKGRGTNDYNIFRSPRSLYIYKGRKGTPLI